MPLAYKKLVSGKVPSATDEGLDDSFDHARNMSVLLLSELRCAGVFAGLDFEKKISQPNDPPAEWPVGFDFLVQSLAPIWIQSSACLGKHKDRSSSKP